MDKLPHVVDKVSLSDKASEPSRVRAPSFTVCYSARTYGFKNTHAQALRFRAVLTQTSTELELARAWFAHRRPSVRKTFQLVEKVYIEPLDGPEQG